MALKTLGNRMIVALEGISEMNHIKDQLSNGGIIISAQGGFGSTEGKLGLADRWGRVVSIGPDCRDVQVGDRVMVQAQKWTKGFKHDDVWLWMTQENFIIFIDELYRESKGTEKVHTENVLEIQ